MRTFGTPCAYVIDALGRFVDQLGGLQHQQIDPADDLHYLGSIIISPHERLKRRLFQRIET